MTPKEYACLAQQAYISKPDIGLESSAARVVFNSTSDGLVLSIPGTNNESSTLADIDAFPHDAIECGFVHKGIWESFDSIWMDVSKLDVYALVGHSEGGAGAIYLAARLCLIGKAPKIVHAFESPRTSIDSRLSEIFFKYGVDIYCYRHGNDLVPMLPLIIPFENWQHPTKLIQFGTAKLPVLNIEDHSIFGVISDL